MAVTNTPDVLTEATAELALALTLAAARRMSDAERDLRAGNWRGWDPAAYRGLEIVGLDGGSRRDWEDRPPLRAARARSRREHRLRGPDCEAGGRERARRPPPGPRRPAGGLRCRQPARAGEAGDTPPDRSARTGADRPGRRAGQHRPRPTGRLRGRRRGAGERDAGRRRPRRLRGRARRTARRCWTRRAAFCFPTSAPRRCARATGWRARSPTTSSRCSRGESPPVAWSRHGFATKRRRYGSPTQVATRFALRSESQLPCAASEAFP